MKRLLLLLILGFSLSARLLFGADETTEAPEKKSKQKESVRARMLEDAKKQSVTPPANSAAKSEPSRTTPLPPPASPTAVPSSPANPTAATQPAPAPETKAAQEPATVLPKVEVRRDRITELDRQIAKQEQDIAREKRNTKISESDKALNDAKVAKPLAILGGESAQYRSNIAKERVSLMESEKDILQAMKMARTKEEKAELQKQLDEIRTFRRELEQAGR